MHNPTTSNKIAQQRLSPLQLGEALGDASEAHHRSDIPRMSYEYKRGKELRAGGMKVLRD